MSNVLTVEQLAEIVTKKTRRKPKTMLEVFKRRYPHHVSAENGTPVFCVTFLHDECEALCLDGSGDCSECWRQPVPEDNK